MGKLYFLLLTVITLQSLLVSASHHSPGLRVAITSKGLEYIQKSEISILEKSLTTSKLPDLTGKVKIHYGIGHVTLHWIVSKLQVDSLSIPISSLTSSNNGLTLKASKVTVVVKGHIHTSNSHHDIIHVSASSKMTVTLSGVSFGIGILISKDNHGYPNVSTFHCSAAIDNVHVHFHSGSKWVYKVANKIEDFQKKFSENFQPTFCKNVKDTINHHGNKILHNLPLTVPVDKYIQINYGLIDDPSYSPQYVSSDHRGEFQLISDPQEKIPFSPPPLPPISNTDYMMYVWLTDYIANTAGLVYHEAGLLKYNITPDMIPNGLPLHLNTSSFRLLLPSLYKTYPNMAMKLNIESAKPPQLSINSQNIDATFTGEVNVLVLPSPGHTKSVATLGFTMNMDMNVWIESRGDNEVICGNTTSVKFVFSIVSTDIGSIPIQTLDSVFNGFGEQLIIKEINKYGRKGIGIPLADGISLINLRLTFGKGYALVSTNMN